MRSDGKLEILYTEWNIPKFSNGAATYTMHNYSFVRITTNTRTCINSENDWKEY